VAGGGGWWWWLVVAAGGRSPLAVLSQPARAPGVLLLTGKLSLSLSLGLPKVVMGEHEGFWVQWKALCTALTSVFTLLSRSPHSLGHHLFV
jgi:hypothetical protein